MQSISSKIKKLQQALNQHFGQRLLYNKQQWYSDDQDRPITSYVLKKAVWDEEKQRNRNIELFKSTSEIQMLLYLRDMWYELNGWEVPKDNQVWNEVKQKYTEKENSVLQSAKPAGGE